MKVLHIVPLVAENASYGGPLRVALNHVAELRTRGAEADIVAGWTSSAQAPAMVDGVAVKLFSARNIHPNLGVSGLISPAMIRWLLHNASRYDVVHVHGGRDLMSLSAMIILWMRQVPFVTQTHGMVMPDARVKSKILDVVLTRRLYRRAQLNFCLTRTEQLGLAQVLGHAGRSARLPNGIDLSGQPKPTQVGPLDVLFCARLHSRKRPLTFVEMADSLVSAGVAAQFSIVGPDDGELETVLREIETRKLSGHVNYEGALPYDAVRSRLSRAAVYVLPSVDEPFPMSVLEALAEGTVCVITNTCGLARPLGEGGAAMVTDGSVEAVTAAVKLLLSDATLRRDLSRRGQTLVADQFSITAVVDRLVDAYRICISD